jgi:hypothetical protein
LARPGRRRGARPLAALPLLFLCLTLSVASARAFGDAARDTPRSLSASVDASLASGDALRARYLLSKLSALFPRSPELYPAALRVGDSLYRSNALPAALEVYRVAIEAAPRDAPRLDDALLRAAELSLYQARDPAAARAFFRRIRPRMVREAAAFRSLSVRLNWDVLGAGRLGLTDGNVAAVHADGDDVWVATWNGGVSRYSLSSGDAEAFPAPATLARSIEVTDRRVWVGTFEGLAYYSKVSARWAAVERFQSPDASKVQALATAGGSLYAGTLGGGLFRQRGDAWEEVRDGGYPGRFITCLAEDRGRSVLLIGTMNLGLLLLDTATGAMTRLEDEHPEFTARNVTAVLADRGGSIWIGTYGEGLYSWAGGREEVKGFSTRSGEIGDDWVLSACETPRGLYFGTFGGGVSVRESAGGSWRRIGIGDGLASLDVTSIAWRAPFVFFGTLGAGVCRYNEADDGAEF